MRAIPDRRPHMTQLAFGSDGGRYAAPRVPAFVLRWQSIDLHRFRSRCGVTDACATIIYTGSGYTRGHPRPLPDEPRYRRHRCGANCDGGQYVVVDWVAQDYAISDQDIRLTVYRMKTRWECAPIKGQAWTMFVPTDSRLLERPVTLLEDLPPGQQYTGGAPDLLDGCSSDFTGIHLVPGEIFGCC